MTQERCAPSRKNGCARSQESAQASGAGLGRTQYNAPATARPLCDLAPSKFSAAHTTGFASEVAGSAAERDRHKLRRKVHADVKGIPPIPPGTAPSAPISVSFDRCDSCSDALVMLLSLSFVRLRGEAQRVRHSPDKSVMRATRSVTDRRRANHPTNERAYGAELTSQKHRSTPATCKIALKQKPLHAVFTIQRRQRVGI
jgi:hypothetical protein